MAQVLYINADENARNRATELGCGWMPGVPAQYANVADAPCVILNGAGHTVVLPDGGALTQAAVAAALAPILQAETAASGAASPPTMLVSVDPEALSEAQTTIGKANTIAGLRAAVLTALDLLNPGT